MHRDKLTMSVSQFEAIKLQIRVELNKCKPRIDPFLMSRTPPERKHFANTSCIKNALELCNKDNRRQEKTPKGRKHFKELETTLSPMNIHRERKHFQKHNIHNEALFLEPGAQKSPLKYSRSTSRVGLPATNQKSNLAVDTKLKTRK